MDFETVCALVEPDWFAWTGVGAFGVGLPHQRAIDFQFQIAIQLRLKRVIVANLRGNEPGPVRGEFAARKKRSWRLARRKVELDVRQNCNVVGLRRATVRCREGDSHAWLQEAGRARFAENRATHQPDEKQ